LKYLILLIFIFSFQAKANDTTVYWTGERDFAEYFGPLDPSLDINYRLGEVKFLDDKYEDTFISNQISEELIDLDSYIKNYIEPGFTCSSLDFVESAEYLHYLHRLVSISLNYEFLRKLHISLYQINEAEEKCSLDYDSVFKSCKPNTLDMKKFVKRSEEFFPDVIDWGKYPLLRKKSSYDLLEKYQGKAVGIVKDYFSDDDMEQSFMRACRFVKNEINTLCNENDTYYGISNINEIHDFLEETSAFKVINQIGSGKACMDRFIVLNKLKESIDDASKKILKEESNSLNKLSEGIFWYGALREFDDLGVAIVEEKKVEPVVVAKKVEEPKVVSIVKKVEPKPIRISIAKPVARPVIKKEAPKVVLSAFQDAVTKFRQDKKLVEVNMTKMKSDYKYSKKILKTFNGPLRAYQTRKALTDMKKIDKLGSKASPLSYLFLRYLIDHNLHQGIYNIIAVLGEQFYVINDVDKIEEAVKIKLDNSEKTKFKWQIWVLEAPI